jgi:hypothetical protein
MKARRDARRGRDATERVQSGEGALTVDRARGRAGGDDGTEGVVSILYCLHPVDTIIGGCVTQRARDRWLVAGTGVVACGKHGFSQAG